MMHCVSCNPLSRLRGIVQEVAVDPGPDESGIPLEASSEGRKRTERNRRRRRDPLGRGRAMTWRTLDIKVAARIEITTRHVRLLILVNWPHASYLWQVSRSQATFSPSG